MRKLIIIRHCKSSWSNSSLSDFERPLNNRGLKDGELMSEKLSYLEKDIKKSKKN